MRTALLAAVGHDLRTPLSGVKAAVSSLRQSDVTYTRQETLELLATIEESTDRLQNLVENLLDASRLEAGVVSAVPERIALIEVLDRALPQPQKSTDSRSNYRTTFPTCWSTWGWQSG